MAHYAKVLNGIVVNVIVADESFFENFVDSSPGEWLKTSYNTRGGIYYIPDTDTPDPDQSKAFRKNFAGVGYSYDARLDAFIPDKMYPSWILNEQTCQWEPPIPRPEDGNVYRWDEPTTQWILMPMEKQ